MYSKMLARSWLEVHEGLRLKPYIDTVGKLTVGYGHNLESSDVHVTLIRGKITEDIADELLEIGVNKAFKNAQILCDLDKLSITRQAVIIDMAFNLGKTGLSKFKNMFAAIADRDFEIAAYEMIDSKWSRQVGERATFLSIKMEDG